MMYETQTLLGQFSSKNTNRTPNSDSMEKEIKNLTLLSLYHAMSAVDFELLTPVQVELTGSSVFDYVHQADHQELADQARTRLQNTFLMWHFLLCIFSKRSSISHLKMSFSSFLVHMYFIAFLLLFLYICYDTSEIYTDSNAKIILILL
jgi:hypothetical protein